MPTFAEDLNTIKSLRQKQGQLNTSAGADTTYAAAFGDKVWDKVRAARAERGISMMQEGVGTTMGQLETDPAQMRARMGADVNPMEQDVLTAKARAQNLQTLGTLGKFESDTQGTIEGAIGAGTNQLIAKAAAKKAEADAAKSEADTLIEQIQLQMEQEKHQMEMATKGTGNEKYMVDIPGVGKVALSGAEVLNWWKEQNKNNPDAVELKGLPQKEVMFAKNIYKAVQDTQNVYDENFSGMWQNLKGGLGAKLNKPGSEKFVQYKQSITSANAAIRNLLSGVAVTPEEEKRLTGLLINTGIDSDIEVKRKLTGLQDYAVQKVGSALSTSGYEAVDPMEYLNRDIQINKGSRPPLSSFDK